MASRSSTIARGGKALYGVPLGILMLEARFPRIPGDMGNAATWPFPVLYRVVSGASPERVVLHAARGLLPDFIEGAKKLVRLGAEASADVRRPAMNAQRSGSGVSRCRSAFICVRLRFHSCPSWRPGPSI